MARELKKILNQRIGLSAIVDEKNFEEIFANGYLLGELLGKFGLQPDFAFFLNLPDDESQIRNFSRILPALEDINVMLPFCDVQKIMQKNPWSAMFLIYNLLKTLKVLPMRDPKWTIENAEKFQRKGSWGKFTAGLNMDYETFRKMDDKYLIPGENHCRNLENRLRRFLNEYQPIDVSLVPLRAEAAERGRYRSAWEDTVKKELDAFDKKVQDDANAGKLPSAGAPTELIAPIRSKVRVTESSERVTVKKSVEKTSSKSEMLPDHPHVYSPTAGLHLSRRAEAEMLLTPLSISAPVTVLATLPVHVKSKPALVFNREDYLVDIRKKAEEYKKRKEEEAKEKQDLWMDVIIEKKHQRELESSLQVIRKINKKADVDRKEAREQLYKRWAKFDQLCKTVLRRQEEDEARQYEYVRVMVNQGFWEMLGEEALSEEKLKKWCDKAELRYFPGIYQILCERFAFCNKIITDHFERNFFTVAETVAKEGGEDFVPLIDPDEQTLHDIIQPSPPAHDREPLFDDGDVIEDVDPNSEIFRATAQPTLSYSNFEMEEYRDIVTQFPYDKLGWMSAFVGSSVHQPRNLGHIVSCVINGKEWRSPPPLEFKYCQKYVSLWIAGKKTSQLKKTIVSRLALVYNLEVISVADLIQEAVEAALLMQQELNEGRDRTGRRQSKGGATAGVKRVSVSKLTRIKSRSLAGSLSSLVSAGRKKNIPRDYFLQRLLKSLMEDGTLDAVTIVDLIEQAIEGRILHPKSKTPEQLLEAAAATETGKVAGKSLKKVTVLDAAGVHGHDAKSHHARADSKTRLGVVQAGTTEKKDELPSPFGWIITDLPISLDILHIIEQRLGIYSAEPSPARTQWQESQLIPDPFGPKPRLTPRSFFGAIMQIDCPEESDLLASPLTPGEIREPAKDECLVPEEEIPPVEQQKTTKILSKGKLINSPQNYGSNHDDGKAEQFSPTDVKAQLTKYLTTFDYAPETAWTDVMRFYEKFVLEHVDRYTDWREPQGVYGSIVRTVEDVMRLNQTVCSFGVSSEAQAQINQVLQDVCQYIWDYRTVMRLQLAQRLIGMRIGKSVVHYLFKQDILLVRDVYCKLEAQLREVVSKSLDRIRKTVGLAVYRKSVFPITKRAGVSGNILVTCSDQTKAYRDVLDHIRQDITYTQPVLYRSPSELESPQELESELLRLKEHKKNQRCTESSPLVHGASADKVFLQNWLERTVALFADKVSCWHRKNELVASVYEIDPLPQEPTVLDFPFLGHDSQPDIFKLWLKVEDQHVKNVLRVLPLLKTGDCWLAANTKQVRESFADCLRAGNFTVEKLMSEFSDEYNRMHELYPDIHPIENWRKKLNRLYLNLCNIVDYRHAGMQCCLRNLMGQSGFTEVIFSLRNACLELFQAEIDNFRKVLDFLCRTYFTMSCHDQGIDLSQFPDHKVPLYLLESEPLKAAKIFMESYDLESSIEFDESMTCGDTVEEQRIFLKIIADDDDFWFSSLQSIRFFLDQCEVIFGRVLQQRPVNYGGDSVNAPAAGVSEAAGPSPASALPDKNSYGVFATKPTIILATPSLPDDTDCKRWLDTFEEHDLEDLLSTVRADIVKRQELKKATLVAAPLPEGATKRPAPPDGSTATDLEEHFSPILNVFHHDRLDRDADRQRLSAILRYVFRQTVGQEINQCMLRLCRIAVECTRKANAVRGIAAETFCVLDSWLRDVHSAEQAYVDKFVDNAVAALQPDGSVSQHDPKRWSLLLPPLRTATE